MRFNPTNGSVSAPPMAAYEGEVIEGEIEEAPSTQLALNQAQLARHVGAIQSSDVLAMMLADKRSPQTRAAYEGDLRHFYLTFKHETASLPKGTPVDRGDMLADIQDFLTWPPPNVALRLTTYKARMIEAQLAEATVMRRLSAVKSLLKFAFRFGISKTDGRGLVDSEKVTSYRQTLGISATDAQELLELPARIHGIGTIRALRDEAMIRLMAQNGLRRAEVCKLNVRDFSARNSTLSVLGKGRGTQAEIIEIMPKAADAILGYLGAAGHLSDRQGALFRNLDHRPEHAGKRITGRGLAEVLGTYRELLDLDELKCHQLRHTAVSQLSIKSGGNVPAIMAFSRHKDANTALRYIHNAERTQGKMAKLLTEVYD